MPRAQPETEPRLARQILSSPYGYAYVCSQAQLQARAYAQARLAMSPFSPSPSGMQATPGQTAPVTPPQHAYAIPASWGYTPPGDQAGPHGPPGGLSAVDSRHYVWLTPPGTTPGQAQGMSGVPWVYGYIAYVSPSALQQVYGSPTPQASTWSTILPLGADAQTPLQLGPPLISAGAQTSSQQSPFGPQRTQDQHEAVQRAERSRLATNVGRKVAQSVEEALENMSVDDEPQSRTLAARQLNPHSTPRPSATPAPAPRPVPHLPRTTPRQLASPIQLQQPQTGTTWPSLSTPRHMQPRRAESPHAFGSEYDIPSATSHAGIDEGSDIDQADEEDSLYDGRTTSPLSPELITPHSSKPTPGLQDRPKTTSKWQRYHDDRKKAHDRLLKRFTRSTPAGPVYVPAFLGATGLAPFTAHDPVPPHGYRSPTLSKEGTAKAESDGTAMPKAHRVHKRKLKHKHRRRAVSDSESAGSDSTAIVQRPAAPKQPRRFPSRQEDTPRPGTNTRVADEPRRPRPRERLSLTPTRHYKPLDAYAPLTPVQTTPSAPKHTRQISAPAVPTRSSAPQHLEADAASRLARFDDAHGLTIPGHEVVSVPNQGLHTASTTQTAGTAQPMSIDTPGYALAGAFAKQQVQPPLSADPALSMSAPRRAVPHLVASGQASQPTETAHRSGPSRPPTELPLQQILLDLETRPSGTVPATTDNLPLAPFAKATHNALFNMRLKRARAKQRRAATPVPVFGGQPSRLTGPSHQVFGQGAAPSSNATPFDFSVFRTVSSLAQVPVAPLPTSTPRPLPEASASAAAGQVSTPRPDRKRRREHSPSSHAESDGWFASLPAGRTDASLGLRPGPRQMGRKEFPLYRQPNVTDAGDEGDEGEDEVSLAGTEKEKVERTGQWVLNSVRQRASSGDLDV